MVLVPVSGTELLKPLGFWKNEEAPGKVSFVMLMNDFERLVRLGNGLPGKPKEALGRVGTFSPIPL